MEKLDRRQFIGAIIRGGLTATAVFFCFAIPGDVVFSSVVQADFASFKIFWGIVFILIGLQFVFRGPAAIEILRGDSKQLGGQVAMPVLIGTGTISASIIVGKRLVPLAACAAVLWASRWHTMSRAQGGRP